MERSDLAIVGAGPGGYTAAIRAAGRGMKTVLIESNEVGGVCLNSGCIPTKSIIASVNRLRSLRAASQFGIEASGNVGFDLSKIMSRKNEIVARLVKGIHQLIKAGKVEYVNAAASFEGGRKIDAGGRKFEAENIIIATGSRWKTVKGIETDYRQIVTSDDLLKMESVPTSIVILGGGVIGCEFASILQELGAEVTIVEALPSILPMEDESTSRLLARAFKKRGIKIMTGTTVSSLVAGRSPALSYVEGLLVDVKLSNGETLSVEKLLVAVGRTPNIEGYGLDKLGVKIGNGAIVTDTRMRTNVEGVYAVGDVNGKYMLAHVASEEGVVAVENITGGDREMDYRSIPRPIYTYPEVCCTGLTLREIEDSRVEYRIGKFAYAALPKALCDGETEGQVTVYSEASRGMVLGAQLIGEHSTEIASEITLAIKNGMTVHDIAKTIHSHPTLSEAVKEAAEDSYEEAIHKVYR